MIINSGNDYVAALKGNQPNLFKDVKANFIPEFTYEQISKGHGRIEKRHVSICQNLDSIPSWPGLVIDFGNGTTLYSRYTQGKREVHTPYPVGVEVLIDEIAQGDFEQYIADQAQAVAPEELAIKEINPHHFEIFAGKQLIAYISYDNGEFLTQPLVVMVNGVEIFRHNTQAWCYRYITWHYKDNTLPLPLPAPAQFPKVLTITEISFYDQEAFVNGELVASISFDDENHENLYWRVLVNDVEIFRDTTSTRCHSYVKQQYQQSTLPVQEPFEEPCTTGNEIMAQIATECEKQGLELLDDGIYQDDVKLGEVGCTDGNWWAIRASSGQQQKVTCDSVDEAVQLLSVTEVSSRISYEELLDKTFDELTADEWRSLLEYQSVLADSELIAA